MHTLFETRDDDIAIKETCCLFQPGRPKSNVTNIASISNSGTESIARIDSPAINSNHHYEIRLLKNTVHLY